MTSGKAIWTWYFLALVVFHYHAAAAPSNTLIRSVPGYDGSFPSNHYGGYVTVDEDHGRLLYYYFVTSQGNPANDPVVLWLNGGPGCSSFDGFIYEHGPFNFEAGNNSETLPKLHLNPHTWSKVSSVIYLDSPSGVGFSYSKTESDYNTGDFQTAKDTHTFLLKWFEEYPEFLSNPFFIAGESFAGIYVPTLASEVSKGIAAGVKPILNFKGYMVGNGVTDPKFDGNAFVPFVHGMGLISDDLFQDAKEFCKENYWNTTDDINCNTKIDEINGLVSRINIYDILEPCYHDTDIQEVIVQKENLPESYKKLGETGKPHPVRRRVFGRAWPLRAPVLDGIVPTWPQLSENVPCFDDRVAKVWLNDESVRKAIHAVTKTTSGDWKLCSDRISYNHDAGSMISYHVNLTSNGYRALIYSGDHDMCVPYTGSEAWTRSLGYAITDSWRPWILNGQVAGYTQGYAHNLTFATIKGSGHTVPEYKPAEALAFFTRFIAGEPL